MSQPLFEIQGDIRSFEKELLDLGRRAPLVMARSVNRAGTTGKTALAKAVAADLAMPLKYVSRDIVIDKARGAEPTFRLSIRGARIPLIAFHARGRYPSRGKGKGVTYKLPTGRGSLPSGFISIVKARKRYELEAGDAFVGPSLAHRGVFVRSGRKRLPIQEKYGPSLPKVYGKFVRPVFEPAALESLEKNLKSEIAFAKSKAAAPDAA